MTIVARKNNSHVFAKFTWNDQMDTCDHIALGVSDEEWDYLMTNKVHEGVEVDGWSVEIDW